MEITPCGTSILGSDGQGWLLTHEFPRLLDIVVRHQVDLAIAPAHNYCYIELRVIRRTIQLLCTEWRVP